MGTTWEIVRWLHLVALAFFVGGQLVLAVAVVPVMRAEGPGEALRQMARRFGIGSAVALAVLIATGSAMASHLDLWSASTLHVKLAVVALVLLLTAVHARAPRVRGLSWAMLALSLLVVWLGVKLTYG